MTTALDHVLGKLDGKVKSGEGWSARCPAHEDHRQSLSVSQGEKGVVLKCHRECATEDICAAMGLTLADLFDTNGNGKRQIVAEYDYTDEDGNLLYQAVRFDPKDFRQRRRVNGAWVWSLATCAACRTACPA